MNNSWKKVVRIFVFILFVLPTFYVLLLPLLLLFELFFIQHCLHRLPQEIRLDCYICCGQSGEAAFIDGVVRFADVLGLLFMHLLLCFYFVVSQMPIIIIMFVTWFCVILNILPNLFSLQWLFCNSRLILLRK